jgi:hypothetical protein
LGFGCIIFGGEMIGTLLGKDEIGKMKDEGRVRSSLTIGNIVFTMKLMKS